jgi:hypothetical protein
LKKIKLGNIKKGIIKAIRLLVRKAYIKKSSSPKKITGTFFLPDTVNFTDGTEFMPGVTEEAVLLSGDCVAERGVTFATGMGVRDKEEAVAKGTELLSGACVAERGLTSATGVLLEPGV